MLPAEEGAAVIYVMASQRDVVRPVWSGVVELFRYRVAWPLPRRKRTPQFVAVNRSGKGGEAAILAAVLALDRSHDQPEQQGIRRGGSSGCAVDCGYCVPAAREKGTLIVTEAGNHRAPPTDCGAPQFVCRYRMSSPTFPTK